MKKLICMLLALLMVTSYAPMFAVEAYAYGFTVIETCDQNHDDQDHGDVTIDVLGSNNDQEANRYASVEVKVEPDKNYAVESVTVKRNGQGGSTTVQVTDKGNGVYGFTMPKGNVTITVKYKSAPAYGITVKERCAAHSNEVAAGHGEVTVAETAKAGETVTVTVVPVSGYMVERVTAGNQFVTDNGDGTYVFTMPASEVTVRVIYAPAPVTKYDVIVADSIANGSVTANPEEAAEGETVTLTAIPDDYYVLDHFIVDEEDIISNTFVMPAHDVNVSAVFAPINYTITVTATPAEGGKVNVQETAIYGETVTIDAIPESGYRIKSVTVRDESGASVAITRDDVNKKGTFVMPASDVVVSAEFELIPTYNVNVDQNIQDGTVTATPNQKVAEDTEVTLTASPATGFELDHFKVDGVKINGNTFEMPDHDVNVSAVFVKANYDVVKVQENGTFKVTKRFVGEIEEAQYGDRIYISEIQAAEGYRFVDIIVTKANGETVEVTSNYGSRYFIMPASDVTVKVNFELIPTYSATIADGITGGTITVTPNTGIKEGETVTVTATPATGYELVSITTDNRGTFVNVVGNKGTFKMPAKDVEVNATFRAINYTITEENSARGSVDADKATAIYGETVTLTATPAAGYALDYFKVDGVKIDGNTFEMPAKDVKVTAEFKAVKYNVTVKVAEGGLVAADKTEAPMNAFVTVRTEAATGYKLKHITVNGTPIEGNKFKMPAKDVEVSAVFVKVDYTITKDEINGTYTVPATAQFGDTVNLTDIEPAIGYEYKGFTLDGAAYEGTTFTMPAKNVLVVAVFVPVDYTVTVDENIDPNEGSIAVSKETAHYLDEIEVTVTPEYGYALEYITVNGEPIDGLFFDMPAEDVVVGAKFKVIGHDVNVFAGFGGTASATPNKNVVAGTDVELTVTPADGYRVKAIKAYTGYGHNAKTVTIVNGKFTMPNEKVNVEVSFEAIYDVNVKVVAGKGTASATPDEDLVAGATVTVTATPDEGYKLDYIKVDGKPINGKTFKVGHEDADVEVAFKAIIYKVNVEQPEEGGEVKVNKKNAIVGDKIEVTATPANEAYELVAITVDGEPIEGNEFTMPAKDVEVSAIFRALGHDVSVYVYYNWGGSATAAPNNNVLAGKEVVVTAIPDDGFRVKEITAFINSQFGLVPVKVENNKFIMPNDVVTVWVTFERIYDVKVTVVGNGEATATPNEDIIAGTPVTVTATPKENNILESIVVTYTGLDGRKHSFNANDGKFNMPMSDVEVTVTFIPQYDVTVVAGENGDAKADKAKAVEGEEVTIYTNPDYGYEVDKIVVTAADGTETVLEGNTFKMPAGEVRVIVTFKAKIFSIHVAETANGAVKTSPAGEAAYGQKVAIYTDCEYGYEIDKIIVKAISADGAAAVDADATTEYITVSEDGTFTMPASAVEVIVTFKLKQYNVNFYVEGELYKTIVVEHGSDAELPEFVYTAKHPEEAYNQKSGWDNDGKNIVADRDINAVYVINEYTVTWIARNKVIKTQVVEHGEDAVAPAVPGRYQYKGEWDKDCKNITKDTVIRARYTKYSTVTITVDNTPEKEVIEEVNPNTGAPAMNIVPAMAVLCAAAYVCKKHK